MIGTDKIELLQEIRSETSFLKTIINSDVQDVTEDGIDGKNVSLDSNLALAKSSEGKNNLTEVKSSSSLDLVSMLKDLKSVLLMPLNTSRTAAWCSIFSAANS